MSDQKNNTPVVPMPYNPMPYRNIKKQVVDMCKEHNNKPPEQRPRSKGVAVSLAFIQIVGDLVTKPTTLGQELDKINGVLFYEVLVDCAANLLRNQFYIADDKVDAIVVNLFRYLDTTYDPQFKDTIKQ